MTNFFGFITCFWLHDELFDVMTYFDVMANFVMSWRVFDVKINIFGIMTCSYSMTDFFDVKTNILASWRVFDVMTNCLDVMTYCWRHDDVFELKSWRQKIRHDVFLMSWLTFWRHDMFFLSHDELFKVTTYFDVMTNFWRLLTSC